MQIDLKDCFTYNCQANAALIAAIGDAGTDMPTAAAILGHILNAHRIWLGRMEGHTELLPMPWEPVSSHEWEVLNKQLYKDTVAYITSHAGKLMQEISYTTTRGEWYCNTREEILFHVLQHGAYHRGQLALLLRQAGYDPPLTDYIFYKR